MLAILVWHFYFVIFNPDAYPMNMSWLNGRLTEREMEEEHPLELERILGAGSRPAASSPDRSAGTIATLEGDTTKGDSER